ncbi:hypothetical protein ACIQ7Q_07530 [Streptomyces sp. NPDC096176]|uniref:hypothetical protein n=1 Tax=Streptomyces sp. NPDC096176 TaxID=3366079 RepID=UPI0038276D73
MAKDLEGIQQAAHEEVDRHLKEVYADPELTAAHHEQLTKVWKLIQSSKTPPHRIMPWRVRLYCGHIVMTSCHAENDKPPRSTKCPECRKGPSRIVAFEPIGLAGEPPNSQTATPSAPRKSSRAELERRIAALEEKNQRLRDEQAI